MGRCVEMLHLCTDRQVGKSHHDFHSLRDGWSKARVSHHSRVCFTCQVVVCVFRWLVVYHVCVLVHYMSCLVLCEIQWIFFAIRLLVGSGYYYFLWAPVVSDCNYVCVKVILTWLNYFPISLHSPLHHTTNAHPTLSLSPSLYLSLLLKINKIIQKKDVTDIKYVINFDFPANTEDYIHRIGRTARAENTGTAYTFFTSSNAKQAKELMEVLKEAKQSINPRLYDMQQLARTMMHAKCELWSCIHVMG